MYRVSGLINDQAGISKSATIGGGRCVCVIERQQIALFISHLPLQPRCEEVMQIGIRFNAARWVEGIAN